MEHTLKNLGRVKKHKNKNLQGKSWNIFSKNGFWLSFFFSVLFVAQALFQPFPTESFFVVSSFSVSVSTDSRLAISIPWQRRNASNLGGGKKLSWIFPMGWVGPWKSKGSSYFWEEHNFRYVFFLWGFDQGNKKTLFLEIQYTNDWMFRWIFVISQRKWTSFFFPRLMINVPLF